MVGPYPSPPNTDDEWGMGFEELENFAIEDGREEEALLREQYEQEQAEQYLDGIYGEAEDGHSYELTSANNAMDITDGLHGASTGQPLQGGTGDVGAIAAPTGQETGVGTGMSASQGMTETITDNNVWPKKKSYKFGMTRSYFVDSSFNTAAINTTTRAPIGFSVGTSGDDLNGIVTMPWSIIPTNDLGLYVAPANIKRIFQDGATQVRVKSIRVRGYNPTVTATNPQTGTEIITQEAPSLIVYKDDRRIFQNQSDDVDPAVTYDQTNSFNVNPRSLRAENDGTASNIAEPKGCNSLNFWIPGRVSRWTNLGSGTTPDAKTIMQYIPQIDYFGKVNLVGPGAEIAYEHKIGGGWIPLYSATGQLNPRWTKTSTTSTDSDYGTFSGSLLPNQKQVSYNGKYPYQIGISSTTTMVNSLVQHGGIPIPVWCWRIQNFNSAGAGSSVDHRVHMYFDYEIEMEALCVKPWQMNDLQEYNRAGFPDVGATSMGALEDAWQNISRPTITRLTAFDQNADKDGSGDLSNRPDI